MNHFLPLKNILSPFCSALPLREISISRMGLFWLWLHLAITPHCSVLHKKVLISIVSYCLVEIILAYCTLMGVCYLTLSDTDTWYQ